MTEIVYDPYVSSPLEWHPEAVEKVLHQPHVFNCDYMGMGKCYETIAAAVNLFLRNAIDFVLVVAPASVCDVWDDPVTGQLFEHHRQIDWSVCRVRKGHEQVCEPTGRYLQWFVVSYPFLRSRRNVDALERSLRHRKFMLVADESSHIKNRTALQTKGLTQIRGWASKRIALNGTPLPNGDPTELWSQVNFTDPQYLYGRNFYQFRNRYAKMGGYMGKNVVGIQNEEELWKGLGPLIIMRKKERPVTSSFLPCRMPENLSKIYDSMNQEMLAWLGSETATASHAGTKAMRLSQITSGFLGGFRDRECVRCGFGEEEHFDGMVFPEDSDIYVRCDGFVGALLPPREVDRTKTDTILAWLKDNLTIPTVVFCRFRPVILRMARLLTEAGIRHAVSIGGQGRERQEGLNRFMTGADNVIVSQLQTGSEGQNWGRAEVVIFESNDYRLKTRLQAEDRARPKIGHPVNIYDCLMTHHSGKKTIDHVVKKKVDGKITRAQWTVKDWERELRGI